MKRKFRPTYPLSKFQGLFGASGRIITKQAMKGADLLGCDVAEIEDIVCNVLGPEHFYKTMEAVNVPGLWQDVYKLDYHGVPIYLKLQITEDDGECTAVLISFKGDESAS